MKPRARPPRDTPPAHDTPRLGRTKVRPLARKPDPEGRYDTGVPDPDEDRKSPWIDEGRPETSG